MNFKRLFKREQVVELKTERMMNMTEKAISDFIQRFTSLPVEVFFDTQDYSVALHMIDDKTTLWTVKLHVQTKKDELEGYIIDAVTFIKMSEKTREMENDIKSSISKLMKSEKIMSKIPSMV
jgi:hypothetical protein